MLISRWVSVYCAPIGLLFALLGYIPITPMDSILGCLFGASFLYLINALFKRLKGHDGLGQGDIELVGCIGAWIGLLGVWYTIFIGSIVGTVCSILYIAVTGHVVRIIPFGTFLALAALSYILWSHEILLLALQLS